MIVGTAGHIDHGKTSLVRALTGIDGDRLAEEKARGMTIDLGFAYADLGDGSVTGFVDVPGHEKLVKTMMAGAGGIDLALIVVAADDGVMPQTREHIAILSLLGLTRAVIAITKSDLADDTRLAEVRSGIMSEIAGTAMAGAPVIAVSATALDGIAALKDVLADEAAKTAARGDNGQLRVAIDRSFTLAGAGTIATGMVVSGRIAQGDAVIVSPAGIAARVRGLRAQNQPAESATAGTRVALNLAGIGAQQVGRGDVVVVPSLHAPTSRIDVEVNWQDRQQVRSGIQARLHIGGAEAGARLVLLTTDAGKALIQLVLDRPLALSFGDRFVLRDPATRSTLGGGRVVDLRPPARRRATSDRLESLRAMLDTDPDQAMAKLLSAPPYHVDLDIFVLDRALRDFSVPNNVVTLGQAPRIAMSATRLAALKEDIAATLAAFHTAHPDIQGMGRESLRLNLSPRLPAAAYTALIRAEAEASRLIVEGSFVRLPGHAPQMSVEDEQLYARIAPELVSDNRFRPPRVRDLASHLSVDEREIRRVLRLAARLGRVDQLAQDHFFARTTTAEMAQIIRDLADAAKDGWFTAPQFRDRVNNGRKVAIEILDFFDRQGVTQRRADLRRINPHRRDLY